MKTVKGYFFILCFLITGSVINAQSLPEAYSGKKLPTEEGWQELKLDQTVHPTAGTVSQAIAGDALKLTAAGDGKYSQLGWYKANTEFNAGVGYTVEMKAKVTNANGSFNISGFDASGKGFRLVIYPNRLAEATGSLVPKQLASDANSDDFHTYRVAVSPDGLVYVYRDGAEIGIFTHTAWAGDNLITDGGFESGRTFADLGWIENTDGDGTLEISENSDYVHNGANGLFVNKGRHTYRPIPMKPGARYDMSYWAKTVHYEDNEWRDVNGWLDPVSEKAFCGVMQKDNPDWLLYDQTHPNRGDAPRDFNWTGGGGVYQYNLELWVNEDLRTNQSAFDDFLLTERVVPTRIPEGAVNLFPNGDFEDPNFNRYFPEGDARNDTLFVSNADDNRAPDWHPFWGARVRLQYEVQPDNRESGRNFSRSGTYSLRYFNCFGHDTQYGVDVDKDFDEQRGYNCNLNANLDLQTNKTYTFSFWYHFAAWGGDHLILVIKNGDNELFRRTIDNSIFPDWVNATLSFATTAENHTLRILTERDRDTPGVLYLDDLFLFEGSPLPEFDNTYLFFGKPTGTEGVDAEIQSVSYDNTGAYAPDGTRLSTPWAMKQAPLMTDWAATIDPNNVLPEYPRPQLERSNWVNLNGIWNFTRKNSQEGFGTYNPNEQYHQQILVPYPIESAISGIMDADYSNKNKTYAYQRTFTIDPALEGKRIILNFGAVDWDAYVFVNGTEVGEHKGGYDPFSFDITNALKPSGEQELVVQIYDPTKGGQPRGKQDTYPGGIWYTPSSGIWQTVWYEAVDPAHITGLSLTPDVDNSSIKIKIEASDFVISTNETVTAEITILDGTDELKTQTIPLGQKTAVAIDNPKLWSPDSPFLYNLKVTLKKGGEVADEVTSYFGMRKIEVKPLRGKPFIFLNDRAIFHYGVLDQGFWPDGLYTAPTYDALRFDIEKVKELGMNMIRKHIKVEPARWYYYCDSIGIMVWQDMPTAAGLDNPIGNDDWVKQTFLNETEKIVNNLKNYPSIVVWVAFNEGWGQYGDNSNFTRQGVDLIRSLDKTRLIDPASGWENYEMADIIDRHNYSEPALYDNPYNQRASICGETGGYGFVIDGHTWGNINNPYAMINTKEELTGKFNLFSDIAYSLTPNGINGIIYTQISDVEEEVNGFYTYDRKVYKLQGDPETALKKSIQQMKTQVQWLNYILPTAWVGYTDWKYTTGDANYTLPDGWNTDPNFDDSTWQEGIAGFGQGDPPGSKIRTNWSNQTIYLRKMVHIDNLSDDDKAMLKLIIHHDEDFELYINGVPAASGTGYLTVYKTFDISPDAKAAIKYGQDNLIAVHVIQTGGGQYIDVGIATVQDIPLDQEMPTPEPPAFKIITTTEEFNAMSNDLGGFYKLGADIDFSGQNYTPIGSSNNPFRGYLDGDEHAISGIKIDNSGSNYQGIFGYADGAYFTDLEINSPEVSGRSDVGSLLGKGRGVTIERVVVNEPVISGVDHVGGIAGGTDPGEASFIQDCYVVNGKVNTSSYQAGGILGVASDTKIGNSYYTGTVTAPVNDQGNNAAGILALTENRQDMMSGVASLATSVTGGTSSEFAARGFALVRMDKNYTYPDMPLSDYAGDQGLGRATADQKKPLDDFKKAATYLQMNWDFQNIWAIDEGNAFPVFRYKCPTCPEVTSIRPVEPVVHFNDLKVYKSGENLVFSTSHPASVWIYTVSGQLVNRLEVATNATIMLPHGAYIVKSVSNGEVKAEKAIN